MPWGRLRLWEGGDGPGRLLAVHGLGGSGRYWEALEALAGDRFRIVAPDLGGFGRSSKPRIRIDREFHLDTLDALTDGQGPWVVVGHSLGGVLSLLWAGRRPERTAALAMAASPYPEPRPGWGPDHWRGPKVTIARGVSTTARVAWPVLSLPAQALAPYPAPVVRDYGRQTFWSRAWTFWSLWSDPTLEPAVASAAAALPAATPVLLRHAADDRSVDAVSLERWSALLPGADTATVPDGGHQFLLRSGFAVLDPWLRSLPVTRHG